MLSIGEYFQLKRQLFSDEWRTRRVFYSNPQFKRCDLALRKAYRFINPYRISKEFFIRRGAQDPYQYGETPLSALERIGKEIGLTPQDRILELGCGRGRGAFFLAAYFGCHVHGIDWTPQFIEKAQKVKREAGIDHISFSCEDMLKADLRGYSVIYLYGTCLEEEQITILRKSLQKVDSSTRVVSVSYPLLERDEIVSKSVQLQFPWGDAIVYW